MTRDDVIAGVESLDLAVSFMVENVDAEFGELWDSAEFSEGEVIALENIIDAAITLNDYLVNFFVEVNADA